MHESDSDCGENGEKMVLDPDLISDYYKSLMVLYENSIDSENKKLNEIKKINEGILNYIRQYYAQIYLMQITNLKKMENVNWEMNAIKLIIYLNIFIIQINSEN